MVDACSSVIFEVIVNSNEKENAAQKYLFDRSKGSLYKAGDRALNVVTVVDEHK